ncbi:hypothetical protein TRVA0_012S02982 [Trichomonascus vanleenenianus]|uniref:uncharacterized protein n=1 Tax=Trichomonascus vanleenenianus TaxID=2268995 RepID=UPI003EC9C18E
MCILFASVEHPSYGLILLSNRDEFLGRETKGAHFWDPPLDHILAPYDLARREHGTWIGISKAPPGKVAVLLNYHEKCKSKIICEISRGVFPRDYLSSPLTAKQWISEMKNAYNDQLEHTGGFTMLCGEGLATPDPKFAMFSNREHKGFEFGGEHSKTICLSNTLVHEPWPKAVLGQRLMEEIIKKAVKGGWDENTMIEAFFALLSHNTYPKEHGDSIDNVKHTIFVPKLKVRSEMGEEYGTRTQTVMLVDKSGHVRYIERGEDGLVEYNFDY